MEALLIRGSSDCVSCAVSPPNTLLGTTRVSPFFLVHLGLTCSDSLRRVF